MSFMDRVMSGREVRPQNSAAKVLPMVNLDAKEVQSLHGSILQVENHITKFKKMVDQLGTGADTTDLRSKINLAKNTIQGKSKTLKERILQFNAKKEQLDTNQQNRLQKAISNFTTILEDFQQAIKLCAEREMANPPRRSEANPPFEEKDTEMEREALLRHQQQQEVVQLDNMVAHNEAIIEERDEEIGGLVRDIAELNEMFQDVAVLVHDQGMMVDDIEGNISQMADHVQSARQELVQAERSQKKATTKKLWILLCITVTLSVVVAVAVLSTG
ncbi:hypothetical protein BSKO_08405 [Bryopsis sp. KO-2023]|nr:hypothetical protein BSKO_08405 [Bryopsis sp. KO-2023]